MLKPKKNIGIVYGHDSGLLDVSINKIETLSQQGYRVKPVILNDESLRRENGLVFLVFKQKFSNIDAALVFMTPDDRALSVRESDEILTSNTGLTADELKKRLRYRPRQNVVYELGYVTAKVGDNKYKVFCPENVEIPSDIQGKFVERNLDKANVENVIEDFVIHNIAADKQISVLSQIDYVSDYSNLCKNQENALDEFEREYLELDSNNEKIFYLFERIVFDSYFQKPEWWLQKINSISPVGDTERLCLEMLLAVSDYMTAWKPSPNKSENIQDINKIYSAKSRLEKCLSAANSQSINPVVKMVGYDYLGLTLNKLGRDNSFNKSDREVYLSLSIDSLKKTIELADQYDDKQLKLWRGFAQFNLARSMHELVKLSGKGSSEDWRKEFHEAIDTRDSWRRCHYRLPIEVREGIDTEYYHAVAERITRIELDANGDSIEKMPYRYTIEDAKKHKLDYEQWWKDPKQIRVRLALNVHHAWDKVNVLLSTN